MHTCAPFEQLREQVFEKICENKRKTWFKMESRSPEGRALMHISLFAVCITSRKKIRIILTRSVWTDFSWSEFPILNDKNASFFLDREGIFPKGASSHFQEESREIRMLFLYLLFFKNLLLRIILVLKWHILGWHTLIVQHSQ